MPETLIDGTGSGNLQRVDSDNRAHVFSVTETEAESANTEGNAFNVNTGVITLTDAVDTPILYFKNTDAVQTIHVNAIAIGIGPSTLAVTTLDPLAIITVIRNPITIDFSTAVSINSNRNYGSAATLTATAYKGATGDTMTDGADHLLFFQVGAGRLFATIDEVLPPGSSMGIKINPAPSNDDMKIYAALILHREG